MRKTYILMEIIIKMEFFRKEKGNGMRGLGFILAIPLAIIFYNLIYALFKDTFTTLSATGNEAGLLGIIFLMATTLIIVTTFVPAISSFYLSENVESYLPLPLRSYQIMLGKAASPLITAYFWNLFVTAPFLFMYMLQAGSGAFFFLFAIIIWVLFPVLPFLFVTSFLMFIMRFINISKYKDRAKALGGFFSLAFVLFINIMIRQNDEGPNEDVLTPMLKEGGLLSWVTAYVPNAKLAAMALADPFSTGGTLALTGFLLLTTGGVLLFLYFSETLYFKGVRGLSSGVRSSLKTRKKQTGKQKSILISIFWRDIKTIVRTPVFFTQILGHQFFAPLFLLVLLFLDSSSSFSAWSDGAGELQANTTLALMLAFSAVIGATSTSATSAFSRDGKSLLDFRYFPITFSELLKSKIAVAWSVPSFALTLFGIILGVMLPLSFPLWGSWLLLSYMILLVTSVIGVGLDMNEPKLGWSNEEEVFQHRFINLFLLFLSALVIAPVLILVWQLPGMQPLLVSVPFLFSVLALYLFIGQRTLTRKIVPSFVKKY
ncbi:putative ABC transporter permease subunit [Salimicrobium flavidum]|uniref:ABC-2 type transport system permease protein n=1 Tax=Salimicrobium flavidum TaxID=570947 RepID=A0A1N7JCX9_9BACI|nr:hypothetical protein [Salimicrobium flavidum]SIS47179.1 ABC-2 type transport system permease protein [Salimicrobium flavidum]